MAFLALTVSLLLFLSPLFFTILLLHLIDKNSKYPVSLVSPVSPEPTEQPEESDQPDEPKEPGIEDPEDETSKDEMEHLKKLDWSKPFMDHQQHPEDYEHIKKFSEEVDKKIEEASKQPKSQEKANEADKELEEIVKKLATGPDGTSGLDNTLAESQDNKELGKETGNSQELHKESVEDKTSQDVKETDAEHSTDAVEVMGHDEQFKRAVETSAEGSWVRFAADLQEQSAPFLANGSSPYSGQPRNANHQGQRQRRPVQWTKQEDTTLFVAVFLSPNDSTDYEPIVDLLGREKFSVEDVEARVLYLVENHKEEMADRAVKELKRMHAESKTAK